MFKPKIGFAAIIFFIVTLVYWTNSRNDFVRYDDSEYITQNPWTTKGLTKDAVAWAFRLTKYAGNWHPLTWISHELDVSVADRFGFDWREEGNKFGIIAKASGPLSFLAHAENVVFHSLNAVLLFVLLLAILKRLGIDDVLIPAVFTLLWAVHPLRVEVVAWASERKELLCVFLMLLSLLLYVSSRYFLSLVTMALALLAKPVAVSLPAVFFAYDFLFLRKGVGKSVARIVPSALLVAAVSILTFMSQTEAIEQGREWTLLTRLICIIEAPAVYLAQTLWPFGLSLDYTMPDLHSWPWMVAGGVLHAVAFAIPVWCFLRPNRWSRLLLFGVAWIYLGLLPMIGIVKVGYEPHSDRYTYWIGCGCACVLTVAAVWLRPLWSRQRKLLLSASVVVLVLLALLTIRQSQHWRCSKSLMARVVESTHSEMFANLLAEILADEGDEGKRIAEDMLRDTLSVRHSANARAALALHLAAFGEATKTVRFSTENDTRFPEARILAQSALEEPCRADWAIAALSMLIIVTGDMPRRMRICKRQWPWDSGRSLTA